jgi:tRNA modification GTPase
LINTGALRNNETIVTNTRHYDALLKAFEEIQKVKQGLDSGLSGDLMAIDVREALYYFGLITGEVTNDDLLGNISQPAGYGPRRTGWSEFIRRLVE